MKKKMILSRLFYVSAIFIFITGHLSYGQNPVDSWTIVSKPAANQDTYTVGGNTYEYGQGNNIELTSITYNGNVYTIPFASQYYVFNRVDINPNSDGVNVVGNKASIFYERTGASNYVFEASLPGVPGNIALEEILKSPVINRGALDVFRNTGTNTSDQGPSNIERVDVVFPSLTINNSADLPLNGFLASEKSGNNTYKAAAILSIDSNGVPTSYGNLVTIQANTSYGIPANNSFNPTRSNSFIEDTNSDNQPLRVGGANERIGISIITFDDLGITAGQTFYGISFFGDDVVDSDNLLDPTTFPQTTNTGADIYGALGAIVTATGFEPPRDSDGDLVLDDDDIDDDNDGIPDMEENKTCIQIDDINTPGFALNTDLTVGNSADLDGLDNGTFDFLATLTGGATWDNGVQIQNNAAIGNFIFAQPQNTGGAGDLATYTFTFPTAVSNFSFVTGGLNNADEVTITASVGGVNIPIGPDNFGNLVQGIEVSGNTVTGTVFDNSFDPLINVFTTTIPGLVDNITITATKGNASNTQVTIGLHSFGYCEIDPLADFDGDGIINSLDLDSDNDGILDIVEAGGTDTNNDGEVDYPTPGDPMSMTDTNMDGLDDGVAANPLPITNSDALGGPDYLDIDADNDGIPDNIEAQSTAGYIPPSGTGTGITDTNTNGVDDAYESGTTIGLTPENTDGADTPDYIDDDSDGDNIPDIVENGVPANTILGVDTDNDGLDDAFDDNDDSAIAGATVNDGINPPNASNLGDENATGDVDYRDILDTDGDGIPDNNDVDDDNDGIADVDENPAGIDPSADSDGDGIPNYLDDNPNNAVIGNDDGLIEEGFDFDNDGIPNHFDLDSDNDGIADVVETGNGALDTDNDGNIDAADTGFADTNNDGQADSSVGTVPANTDGNTNDGSDFLDIDADDDGIPDNVESQPTVGYTIPSGEDLNNNGLDDAYEGTNFIDAPENTDGADTPDYLDTDSDNDGIDDLTEAALGTFTGTDTDGDGLDDGFEGVNINDPTDVNDEVDNPTTLPNTQNTATPEVDYREIPAGILDNDNDGIEDSVDLDDDNDGILDVDETGGDFDGDGIPNWFDLDSDNDGITDTVEAGGTDADGDGIIDGFIDANMDGLDDTFAANPLPVPNSDGSSVDGPDYLDIDADDDGIPDNIEAQPTIGYVAPNGTSALNGFDTAYPVGITPEDTDGDSIPDYLDSDSDNDGIDDLTEGGQGTLTNVDTDGDGLDDGFEGSVLTDDMDVNDEIDDPTTLPDVQLAGGDVDYREGIDSDGDGVLDVQEIADGTDPNNPCDYVIASITETQTGAYLAADCDGDGVTNGTEITDGTNPEDSCDYVASSISLTPSGDFLSADCDGDGVTNGTEINEGTDPTNPCDFNTASVTLQQGGAWSDEDCDMDTIPNGQEITQGTDPYDPCSSINGTPPAGVVCDISIETDLVGPGINNGIFRINNIERFPDNTVRIYNRWGILVYETKGYDNDSNAFKGISEGRATIGQDQELPVGVYFYIIEYLKDGNLEVEDGYLYVNR